MVQVPEIALIVDLDHTLIHTTFGCRPDIEHIYLGDDHFMHIRPFVREFLSLLLSLRKTVDLKVGFWTAGTEDYAQRVVGELLSLVNASMDDIDLLWSRNQAQFVNGYYIKRMAWVEDYLGVETAFLLDDSDEHSYYNPHRFLSITKYHVEDHDTDIFLREFIDIFLRQLESIAQPESIAQDDSPNKNSKTSVPCKVGS